MKKGIMIFLFFLTVFNCTSHSQNFSFKVLASSNHIFKEENKAKKLLVPGILLFQNENILMDYDGYLCLVNSSNQTIEINKKGTYKVSDLEMRLKKNVDSGPTKFVGFILNEVIEIAKAKKKDHYAAVVRERMNRIEVSFPHQTYLIDTVISISWYKVENNTSYIFRLISPSKKTIMLKRTVDTCLTVDLKYLDLKPDSCYNWFISLIDDSEITSDTCCVKIIQVNKKNIVQQEINGLNSLDEQDTSAISQIIKAKYLEQNDLNLDALLCYEKALILSGKQEDYKNLFYVFLLRNRLLYKASRL